jgi:SAM-dependent methyltransferase
MTAQSATSTIAPQFDDNATAKSGKALHRQAAQGFQNASAYDAHRPSYLPVAVEGLLSHLGISGKTGANIVDLAAGTGKLTEILSRRPEFFNLVAVEPHEQMRGQLVAKNLDRLVVKEGFAANMPVEDGWANVCMAAQVGKFDDGG